MYVNVWLGGGDFNIPGLGYPGGGAMLKVLDMWKFDAPHIDLIAPDIYIQNYRAYVEQCDGYDRDDNPLFVPESAAHGPNAAYMFYAVGARNAIGYAVFGVESAFEADGTIKPESVAMRESNEFLQNAMPLLHRYRGTGKMYSVVQEDQAAQANYEFEKYYGCVKFVFGPGYMGQGTGYKGRNSRPAETPLPVRGLIFEAGPDEFYLTGNFHLKLAPKVSPDRCSSAAASPAVDFASVEEGYFDDNGEFVATDERNGDEVMFGDFWAAPHSGVTRVRLI
jgi:hypothetical protein